MTVEQALKELKKYADEFAKIGDADQAIKNNKDEFMHKWIKVYQYFKYIFNNKTAKLNDMVEADEVIEEIADNNPSLKKWTDMITEQVVGKEESQDNTKSVDTSALAGHAESLITEIENMQRWDSDYVEDLEWLLKEDQRKLIENKDAFEPGLYQSLMDDINFSLDKINRFYNLINSDLMGGVHK